MTQSSRTGLYIFVLTLGLALNAGAAVKASQVNTIDLNSITEAILDSNVEVEATVKSITLPGENSRAPVKIELTDSTGSITLVIWQDLYATVKTNSPVSVGDTLHANARVSKYRDNLQLQIRTATDVKIVSKASAPQPPPENPAPTNAAPTTPAPAIPAPTNATPATAAPTVSAPTNPPPPVASSTGLTQIADITAALMNREVTVQASIAEIREPRSEKSPCIVTLTQDNARIPLVFWSDVHQQIKTSLKVGSVIRVKTQVVDYRGKPELKLRNVADFSVVNAPK